MWTYGASVCACVCVCGGGGGPVTPSLPTGLGDSNIILKPRNGSSWIL